jgi:hypothetical protein
VGKGPAYESGRVPRWRETGRVPVRVEIEDGAFSRVLNNPGTTPDCTGGMRPWRNVPGT